LKSVDEDYLDLYKLKIIAGQNFSKVKNTGDIIVNRKLTELLGFSNPDEALGERIDYTGNEFKIVGVVEDFHAQSLHKSIENVIFGNFNGLINEMAIKINPTVLSLNGYKEMIQNVQTEWDLVFLTDIMNYTFFDEKIASLYKEEKNTANLIQLFALIAILIGSLGLYGLISYIISQKTKEISIRKVNGAKVSEMLILLNKDFAIYFAIAFVIACPIAFHFMDKWLQNFAYKTELSWWLFALAGVISMLIALLTVSRQTFVAARKNPVEAFRYE
jgi:putative ABC transport system permease protein